MSDEAGSSSSVEGFAPTAAQASDLVKQFAAITSTDTACAQFYLQDRDWNLERSLDAYYETKRTGGVHVLTDGDEPQIILNINKDVKKLLETAATEKPPSEFRVITWNIDGLDDHNLKIRTKAVIKIIENENPDIVFLQEVVPKTLNYIEENLPQFKCIPGDHEGYFTVTMINQFTTYYDDHRIIKFPQTTMGRNLLQVDVHIGPSKLRLLNSHLESTGEHAEERMNQLRISFDELRGTDESVNVIFGGDLNMRDKEVDQIGLPNRVHDVWISCGSRKECQWTWDTMRNTNKQMPGKFKPRCRFDRVYFRPATAKESQWVAQPKFFGLIGLQKIANYQCFPSDHWGLLMDFDTKMMS